MSCRRAWIYVVLIILFAAPVGAQTIDDLGWIAGTWVTDLEDQALEERWAPPLANAMTGSFRWTRDGAVWLYEFLLIEETENGIFYYLRHFGPGSRAWEERDAPITYQLASSAPGRAEFESPVNPGEAFVFSREDDQLTIEIRSPDADTRRFVYSLRQPAGADADSTGQQEPPAREETAPNPDPGASGLDGQVGFAGPAGALLALVHGAARGVFHSFLDPRRSARLSRRYL